MTTLHLLLRSALNVVRFPWGLLRYRRTGQTDPWAHQALVQLFCTSGGRFYDLLSALLRLRYDYTLDSLLDNADVQALLADPTLLALAQRYLGALPRAEVLSMWWHTNFRSQPDSEPAQFYHFDLDRIKWLKIFIYLTDVGPDDGPHSFIEGSHRSGAVPGSMLRKGYARLSDEEVLGHYGKEREIEFAAPRGTIIVEDTRGLHKGEAVSGRSRLVLQLQFSNSLFGAAYAKATLRRVTRPGLARLIKQSGDVYAQYL